MQSASFLQHETQVLGAACGVHDFLRKPCEPEEILETVNRVLKLPVNPAPVPQLPSSKDPVPLLLDAFYEKGQQLDSASVRLAALLEVAMCISSCHDIRLLLEKGVEAARKITGANFAVLGIMEGDGPELAYFATSGLDPNRVSQFGNWQGSALQTILSSGKPLRAFRPREPDPQLMPAVIQGFLGVPVRTAAAVYGWLYVADRLETLEFPPEDEQILSTVAAQLAVGYENLLRLQNIQDYTAKLEAEVAQRQRAEERFRLLVQSAPTGILLCDDQGRITEGNAQVQQMFGYTREELLGQRIELLVPEQHRVAHASHRAQYMHHPQVRPMGAGLQLQGRRKDGTLFPAEISLAPLVTDRGVSIASTVVDISERKKLERQVQMSQRLEAVGQLAAGIAHDFNNILTAITGNAKLALADLPSDSPARQSLAEIEKAAWRATKLVRQILSFSRQEPLKSQVINLRDVVEEALQLLRAGMRSEIKILTHFQDPLPDVAADSTQIHQIIMNLGTNAADAMEQGGVLEVRLESSNLDAAFVRAHPSLQPGDYVCLSVRDSGCGMDKGTVERIFEPFYTTKPLGKGTGLGLSVVHGIVQSHGGAITVNSEPGSGTEFQIYFPVVQCGAASEARPPQSVGEARGHGQSVLYVDDEEPLVFLMTRMLRRLGYGATGFSDPEKAIEAFRARPLEFDVVVSDLSMPGMTGIDLARALLEIRPGMPILIASGYIRPADNEQVQSLGLPGLILKPDTVDQMGNALQAVFEKLKTTPVAGVVPNPQSQPHRRAASTSA